MGACPMFPAVFRHFSDCSDLPPAFSPPISGFLSVHTYFRHILGCVTVLRFMTFLTKNFLFPPSELKNPFPFVRYAPHARWLEYHSLPINKYHSHLNSYHNTFLSYHDNNNNNNRLCVNWKAYYWENYDFYFWNFNEQQQQEQQEQQQWMSEEKQEQIISITVMCALVLLALLLKFLKKMRQSASERMSG